MGSGGDVAKPALSVVRILYITGASCPSIRRRLAKGQIQAVIPVGTAVQGKDLGT